MSCQGYVGGVGYTGVASQWQVIGTPGPGKRLETFKVNIFPFQGEIQGPRRVFVALR